MIEPSTTQTDAARTRETGVADASSYHPTTSAAPRLSFEEALELYRTAELSDLAREAQRRRYLENPSRVVTYLVDRNINYTNVCNTDCSFCAFYRPSSKHPEAYVLSKDALAQKIEETLAFGGTRILLQGGHNDDLPFNYYVDLVSWISSRYPIEINAFSPSEIQQMCKVSGMTAEQVLSELQSAGLRGLPGGGGEILDDEIRARVSPKKTRAGEWLAIMEVAQALGLTTTATMVIGFGEGLEHRLRHLEGLRALQDRARANNRVGFNLFISWTLKLNEHTSMGRSRHSATYGATTLEYLRNLCIARIFLDNVQHHQSSWPTLGAEIAQLGLQFGCDDIGSTMMEENVVSQAGAPTKEKWCMSPEELRAYIRGAGFVPAQRDSSFNLLQIYEEEAEAAQ